MERPTTDRTRLVLVEAVEGFSCGRAYANTALPNDAGAVGKRQTICADYGLLVACSHRRTRDYRGESMTDEFAKQKASEMADDLWAGVSMFISSGVKPRDAFKRAVSSFLRPQIERHGQLVMALQTLLEAPGDHMTACDRTMGATHPCTCGANDARRLLGMDTHGSIGVDETGAATEFVDTDYPLPNGDTNDDA